MSELWKPVVGYEGRYEVSSLGRVRSLPKFRQPELKLLKTPLAADGYPVVRLYDGKGGVKTLKVHRLVLLAFEGPPPEGKPYALHKFGIRSDPRLNGLYWGSPQQNQMDRIRHKTSNRGERNGQSLLTLSQVKFIKDQLKDRKRGDIARLARAMHLNSSIVSDIVRGVTWSHV